uniref:Putative ribonuclease H-like domain-containing protein n=1 Tax=Tanacetum cinerariifolium TaxID=118510 RepID=A0A6L2K646_TANCI|nr:putative ribonuclease H-like domain-containing protein [Tanacetum cinerariifolium]
MTGDDNRDGDQPKTSNTTPPIPPPTQQIPHIVSSIKFPILKKGEYDIWTMKMENYLSHTDYPIWQVIHNGNGPVFVTTDTNGMIKVLPSKTAEEIVSRERERKAKTTLLMALPEDHLAKFHKMADAKEIWEAIKSIFGGNDESKKMQKYLLKQQFEGFSVSASEGLHKGSLPSFWSHVALIMRNKSGLDTLSFDDLYNNLRVFERDVNGTTTSSSSNTQNVVFVSSNNTSSTNDINDDDIEEMDLKWQVAMISMRIKKFYKRTCRKLQFDTNDPVDFYKTKVECFNCHKKDILLETAELKGIKTTKEEMLGTMEARDNGRRPRYQDDSKALVTIDGEDIDWFGHVEEDTQNYAMMDYSFSNSGSDNKVKSCSKTCEESYARLKKLYDEQRDKLGDASVEITAYTLALKKVEAQLLCHQQNQLAYEQKIRFMKIDLDDKTDMLTYHKKLLAESLKEKEDLKTKFENWQNSSKNLSRLLNTQVSANDKFGLGYGDYRYGTILNYENEVLQSVFMNKESDLEDTPINDRYVERMHAVPPPMTWNYMPSRPDVKIDYSKFTYGPKQTSDDESDTKTSVSTSCESDYSTDAPIIEEYESDSDDDSVSNVQEDKEKPSFAFTNFVKHVKSFKENVKETGTPNHCPKIEKQDRKSPTRKGLGYAFTRKACFVCGSFRHLIRDCDFHEKRMAKQAELTKSKNKDDPHKALKDKGIVDRKIQAGMLDFEDVYYVEELKHYNLFYVSQMYDKKNKVLFTDTDCLVLSPDFKLPHENQDETTPILKDFIRQAKNQFNHKVKPIRSNNEIEFKNHDLIEFRRLKGIKREYSNARTPQQNRVAERKNMTPIEAARTMLADLFLPTTFWAEAVNTACYVLNRVLVTKPQNKTPYELLTGRQPIISYLRPFGCHVTILNTIDQLGKFDEKFNSRFLVGYSLNSKAFRVYNLETKRVEENLHVNFLENKPNVSGKGHAWMFDLDYLTNFMNYEPVSVENQAKKSAGPKEANNSAGTQVNDDQGANSKEIDFHDEHFVLPIWSAYSTSVKSSGYKIEKKTDFKTSRKEATHENQDANTNNTKLLNAVSLPISTTGTSRALNDGEASYLDDPLMPHLEDIYANPSEGIFTDSSYDDEGVVTDFNNLETTMNVSPTPTTRIHTIHPKTQILGDPMSAVHIRSKVNKDSEAHALVYRNKKDERGVVVRNKARLVAQGHGQEEGLDYDEVFAFVARIEAIRIFLAFASYMGFIVYQMDVKSAFLYGTINEEVYVTQLLSFVDSKFPNKVYKVVKALYGLHKALRAWYATLSTFLEKSGYRRGAIDKTLFIKQEKKDIMLVQVYADDIIFGSTKKSWCDEFEELMKNRFQMSSMGELTFFLGLQVKQKEDGIFISQDKYVTEILKKFDFLSMKIASTPIETQKPLVKDEEAADVDVTPKTSHLQAVKRIFSDYAGANLDRKSTTEGCQFISRRLISWQCKKQTIVATSTTEAEYVAAAHCSTLVKGRLLEVTTVKHRVVVTEDVIRYDLRLDDADGVECLPNEEIFTELTRMSYEKPPPNAKSTAWNEFSCLMASAVICLATGRKFNFSKYIFDSMYTSLALTQKVFANMCRVGKGFSGVETPLFATMLVQPQAEVEEDDVEEDASKQGERIEAIDADEDATMVDAETQVDLGAELQGRKDDDNAAIKDASAAEPTVFDDEVVTMTMAHTLIKMKAEKARLLDEQMAKRLHDKEVEQAATREKQEKEDLEKAKVLQKQYEDKQENIDWNTVVEQMQEKHLDNIKKYQSLKIKPISVAQAKKNMIVYLKNMAGYKMEYFKGMTYDKVRPIFEREYNKVQTLFKHDKDEEPTKKRVAEETLLQESFKKLKAVKVSGSHSTQDTPTDDPKEMSKEDVKNMLEIVPVTEFKVEALQVKYPLIDWKIHSKGSRTCWKIIRVGGIIQAYQSFEDMLKDFDREDLDVL